MLASLSSLQEVSKGKKRWSNGKCEEDLLSFCVLMNSVVDTGLLYMCQCCCDLLLMLATGIYVFHQIGVVLGAICTGVAITRSAGAWRATFVILALLMFAAAYACTQGLAALTQNFVRAHRRWLSCWFTDVESLKEIGSSQPTKASGRFHEALAEAEFFVHHYIWPLQLGHAGDLYHLNVERHVFNLQTLTLSGCTQCVYYWEFVEKLPKMDECLVLG